MNAPVDIAALKSRQQAAWSSGDYAVIGTTLQIVGESLAEACECALAMSNAERHLIYEHFNAHETVGAVVADALARV